MIQIQILDQEIKILIRTQRLEANQSQFVRLFLFFLLHHKYAYCELQLNTNSDAKFKNSMYDEKFITFAFKMYN